MRRCAGVVVVTHQLNVRDASGARAVVKGRGDARHGRGPEMSERAGFYEHVLASLLEAEARSDVTGACSSSPAASWIATVLAASGFRRRHVHVPLR